MTGRVARRRRRRAQNTIPGAVLPAGFTVRIRPEVETLDGGRVLLGGSPLRAAMLSRTAAAMVRNKTIVVDGVEASAVAVRLLDGNLADPILVDRLSPEELTAVVPARDRPQQLDRTLAALSGLKVIVVDDASHDRAAVAAVADRHRAQLVSLPTNAGPAGARNAGLSRVASPYVAFVDSDVTVDVVTLCRLGGHFDDPRVALVGPLVQGRAEGRRLRWFERYDAAASSLSLGTRPCSVRPGAAVGWLPSACLVARTQALSHPAIDGFDPALRVGEDVDLVWRLVADGYVVRYDPSFTAYHQARETVAAWLGRKLVYGTGSASLATRHGDAVAPAILSPAMAVAGAVVLLRRPRLLPLAGAAVVYGAVRVATALPDVRGRHAAGVRIALRGCGWAVRQESALVLRHWWPISAVAFMLSAHARRVVTSALVVDAIVTLTQKRPPVPPPIAWLGSRLDDLAYGAGLWIGAVRAHSFAALKVKRV